MSLRRAHVTAKWSGTIRWSFDETETEAITTPALDMAAAALTASSHGLTHGRGYGSNRAGRT